MDKKYDYQKIKKALQETHQLPPEIKPKDKKWESEIAEKEAEDRLNPSNKSPEEIVKLKKGDYDYYKVKKAMNLR